METLTTFFTENFWAAVSLIATITVPVASFINTKFEPKKIWKQVISWGVGFVLTVVCYFLNMINLGEPLWITILLTGFVAGLSSNGLYDIPTIKSKVNNWMVILLKKQLKC